MAAVVRDLNPADEADWRRLWSDYVAFYEASVDDATTTSTLARILDPFAPLFARVVEVNGRVAGFSVSLLHEGTWVRTPICYLEDLFVDPAQRGAGLGRALIEDLITLGRGRGWSRLYWHTRESNGAARRLYDRFVAADGFVRYVVPLT
jgi:GNAT superfamily N-acetyltransferase